MEGSSWFDITPDPRVLVALTQTPLQPLDALCELIDNAIDSFAEAERRGNTVEFPLVLIDLPGAAEVGRGAGVVRVRDNGPGLSPEQTTNAIRAGYSGKKRFGSLGLFGMGFNIATGKLGQRTRFSTAVRETSALCVEIDLPKIVESRRYEAPVQYFEQIPELPQGTSIEIDRWWPDGNPNHSFIRKLAGYTKESVRQEIGRRYATILRSNRIRIVVNGEPCVAFEHCVWDKARFVERTGHGRIPAQFTFDEVVGVQHRCLECDELITASVCAYCGGTSFRTVEERVRGWVGIQRFDDLRSFGVDLIRNGRAIRVFEQAAFFEYTDEFKKTVKDYPIDGPYGRIIGEVNLDHVPVDFLKQDFQRSSDEWQNAMRFLRGESSLQPNQPNADKNSSPIFKLYQGYRRVRNIGTRDMYMGFFDDGKPKRISRERERELYAKFLARLPGYYDDAEWWKLVEQADTPPPQGLVVCSNTECGAQNPAGAELCQVCMSVLLGKDCVHCGNVIALSAITCDVCGGSQVVDIVKPWQCQTCGMANPPEVDNCSQCGRAQGVPHPASREHVIANADRRDDLSVPACTVFLADGATYGPFDVDTYATRQPLLVHWQGMDCPVISFRASARIEIFFDPRHALFKSMQVAPEVVVAQEIAQYVFDNTQRLTVSHAQEHTLALLFAKVIEERFGAVLEASDDRVRASAEQLLDGVRLLLSQLPDDTVEDLFAELGEEQQKFVVSSLVGHRQDLSNLAQITSSAKFLRYVDNATVVDLMKSRPHLFFDGRVFQVPYSTLPGPAVLVERAQSDIRGLYLNCVEDLAQYLQQSDPSTLMTIRARSSVELLTTNFE